MGRIIVFMIDVVFQKSGESNELSICPVSRSAGFAELIRYKATSSHSVAMVMKKYAVSSRRSEPKVQRQADTGTAS